MNSGPSIKWTAVTKSDTTVLASCRALWVGTAGDVVCDDAFGHTDITFKNVPSGTLLPIAAYRVKAATSASDIVALQ